MLVGVRSPLEKRFAVTCNRRIGCVIQRARSHPTAAAAIRTTTAIPVSASQKWWMRSSTSLVSRVSRTTPCTVPPDATGTATYSRSVSRVSECRIPTERCPPRAVTISGLVDRSRSASAPVSTSEMPDPSITTTRAPGSFRIHLGRCRIGRRAVLQRVLVDGGHHHRIPFDVGAQPVLLALAVEHGQWQLQHQQHDRRDREVAEQEPTGHDAEPGSARAKPTPRIVSIRSAPIFLRSEAMWTSSVFVDPHQCSSHTSRMISSRVRTAPRSRAR